jgi:SIR2-like domain
MPKKRIKLKHRFTKRFTISPAAEAFIKLVQAYSYKGKPATLPSRFYNMTFWAGAGFSKAWQPKSPTGPELFTFDAFNLMDQIESSFINILFGDNIPDHFSLDYIRQIVYFLDMYERYPDVRGRYIDAQNVRIVRAKLRSAVLQKFQAICGLNYFDEALQKFPSGATSDQRNISQFFGRLSTHINGSMGVAEGLRYHFITTNYDFVIETILDDILAPDESFFIYTYRGFTPDRFINIPNVVPVHENWLAQHLIKLNGGFEIIRSDAERYELDYSNRALVEVERRPPILMLPSREQDYTDAYFKAIFPKSIRLLQETDILVIVGYSLPPDDALIRFIVRQFAEHIEDALNKHIFYVDFLDARTKNERLQEIFPYMERNFPTVHLYEGGFGDFVRECLSAGNDGI